MHLAMIHDETQKHGDSNEAVKQGTRIVFHRFVSYWVAIDIEMALTYFAK
jgi:hypothetical protein